MSKIKFVLPLVAVALLTSCLPSKKSSSTSTSGSTTGSSTSSTEAPAYSPISVYPDELLADLNTLFGEDIPVAPFDNNTFDYGYDDSYEEYGYGHYVIYDDYPTNIFSGYESKLTGYTKGTDEEGETVFTKTTANGTELELYFDFYEATDEYAAGNQIDLFFPSSEE